MSAGGGKKAIFAALSANAGIAVAKFVGAAITGSGSMLAEAVHSVADTGNQGLLLLGQKRAEQEADDLHPFGYGRNRYFYSFVVALVLFSLGSMYAIYEGVHKIQHPEELTSPAVAIVILGIAAALEGYSFMTAMRESSPLREGASWWRFIRNSRSPELPVVLLEDTGALIGLLIALVAVVLTVVTDNAIWDGIGTLGIGVLLGVIAVVLIVEMKSLLIGEGATPAQDAAIRANLVDGERIDRVIHLRTEYLGPEEMLVAAKVSIVPGLEIADIATAIDDAEARVRAAVPAARVMYIEPDLYRTQPV
ncbi:cation diffusion facilitator family transporter [Nocardia sp. 852002-20019_SCH5090214]|jgi:cation diffusion facilitator family transporter|uniref:Cation transporter n=1 Tax=Nocardia nova TaxID=37330 RepID=A0A2S6A1K6_9NOCA|nr:MULTISPECIES: cation diffusion facilitator family transporter [Nocardia]OBF86530.1 cation diffusion facilitator family transporter [Mycobacterium sp. 852002-51759_SCH5129042]MBF6145190.1 cation diffusion facilitator family transporter [Nocardia nova]MBF6275540.1 cation diffusion facilitator family transporter [Nocardia nova]MBV7704753.1 cation diffusion facilitator family transporter [Nocardia nova]OBA42069.1 cation diffusion facilitator family transporter [Nocardia sp. 852002-20019_SCH5090